MRRRKFLALLGSATAAWPLGVQAQQSAMPVIGFLSSRTPEDSSQLLKVFHDGLSETGIVENRDIRIEYRWALGVYDRLPALVAELTRIPVDVLVAVGGDVSAHAAVAAAKTVPLVTVFAADPVKGGLIESLGHPGGNVTGVSILSATVEPKRIGLLRDLLPQAKTFSALLNPNTPTFAEQLADIQAGANTIGVQMNTFRAGTDDELEQTFEVIAKNSIPAVLVTADPFFNIKREKIATIAARWKIPAIYAYRDHVIAGGLMSYGVSLADAYRQMGVYTGRVLKGAHPRELPVAEPTKFQFVINLKVAKTLGLKISDNLLSIADEVIE
jgi:putative ABC transport system substrate-binding protein